MAFNMIFEQMAEGIKRHAIWHVWRLDALVGYENGLEKARMARRTQK